MWSNHWKHGIAVAEEVLIVLDLAQPVSRNMRNENEGNFKIHVDWKLVWAILVADRFKASQCAMDRGSIINKIIEIERESKVSFEHTRVKITNELENTDNGKGKTLVLKCDMKSKKWKNKMWRSMWKVNNKFKRNHLTKIQKWIMSK